MIIQGKSSQVISYLYKNSRKYKRLLASSRKNLIRKYPNKNITSYFSLLGETMITTAPLQFCESLLIDLDQIVEDDDLIPLSLLVLAIATHDDAVDQTGLSRVQLASLIYSGDIAANEGVDLLIKRGKVEAAQILLQAINKNHFYQQHITETLWQEKPKNFEQYADGIFHVATFAEIGLFYGLALANRLDLKQQISNFSYGYGIAIQIIDDLREQDEDKKNGYWSYPIVEGEPYTQSIKQMYRHIKQARESIPSDWQNLNDLLDRLEKIASQIVDSK
jgi:hypothetical protein